MAKGKRGGGKTNKNNNQPDNQDRAGDAGASGQGGAGLGNVRDEVVDWAAEGGVEGSNNGVEGVDNGAQDGERDGGVRRIADSVEALDVGGDGAKEGGDGVSTNEGRPKNDEMRFWDFEGSERTKPKSPKEVHEFEHPTQNRSISEASRARPLQASAALVAMQWHGNDKVEFQKATGIDLLKPALSQSSLQVRTNHFKIYIGNPAKDFDGALYVYRMNGIPTDVTRAKKGALMKAAIDKCWLLNLNKDNFATDHMSMIVANCDLFVEEFEERFKQKPQLKEVVAHITVYDHNRRTHEGKDRVLELVYEDRIPLQSFKDYVAGTNPLFAAKEKFRNNAVHALNLMIGKYRSDNKAVFPAGRDRFFQKDGYDKLGDDDSKVAFRGYSYTTRGAMGDLLLNVNTATSVFYKPMYVSEYLKHPGTEEDDLIGVRVWVTFSRGEALDNFQARTKTISEFGGTADKVSFEVTDPTTKKTSSRTVFRHVQLMKYKTAGSEESICVNTNPIKSDNKAWFLAEDLYILPYQIYKGKLSGKLTSAIVTLACREPQANINAIITEGLPALDSTTGCCLLPARRAAIAQICYANPASTYAFTEGRKGKDYGVWNIDAETRLLDTNYNLIKDGASSESAAFFLIQEDLGIKRQNELLQQLKLFHQHYGTLGPEGLGPAPTSFHNGNSRRFPKDTSQFNNRLPGIVNDARAAKPSIIVMILPQKDREIQKKYCAFKALMEQTHGEVTLCLSPQKLYTSYQGGKRKISPEGNDSPFSNYCRNVALKLNIRLGNVNHALNSSAYEALPRTKPESEADGVGKLDTIILCADVIHPGATRAEGTLSIAAVVGSVDQNFAKYLGSMRRQKFDPAFDSKEIIDDGNMKSMVVERLQAWAERNGNRYPTNIIYYRDGVGESQFAKLRTTEIAQIRSAFEQVVAGTSQAGQKCKVTAIIVTKRHNVRLYPTGTSKEEMSSTENCHAGTVVDQGVTTPYHFDFYLMSQHGLQGTSRPAHYFVVDNELELSMTQLQDFTFALCHLYQRSTTSVGYATPAYYADHLCERGRAYVREFYEGGKRFKDMNKEAVTRELDQRWRRGGNGDGNPWKKSLDDKMFWL